MARLFISHSSRNNDKAIEVRDWLAANGWDDVFLDLDPERGIVAGQRWKQALQKAASRCEVVLALVSAEWLASSYCKAEINTAQMMGKKTIIALIDKSQVPGDLTDEQFIDLSGDPQAYRRLKKGLELAGLDPLSFPFEPGRRPYPGFAYFEEQDVAVFFGRDAQIVRGLDELRRLVRTGVSRMLVILGASGSGKSSFLRAGLWPRLKRDDRAWLPLPIVRPERAVISGTYGLAGALHQIISETRFSGGFRQRSLPRSRADIEDFIKTEDGLVTLFDALRDIGQVPGLSGEDPSPPTIVLALDQGEELFNEEGRDEAERFVEILTRTLKADPRTLAILAMRSDSFPLVQANPSLAALPKDTFTLDMMLEGSYRAVIEDPARLIQPTPLRIDPQLTEALLKEISGQDALPLLAFTLAHLYEKYRTDNELTLAGYDKLGHVSGVIDTAVKGAFAAGVAKGQLPNDAKAQLALARAAFIPHLAQVNPAGQFVRRVATLDQIPADARPLIDSFAEQRLLIKDRRKDADGKDVDVVEVAHETLLRQPPFSEWLEEDREFLIGKLQLQNDLRDWAEAKPADKKGALLTGLKLSRMRAWLQERPQDLTPQERDFGRASIAQADAEERRKARQRRIITRASIAAAVVLACFAVAAGWQWNVAEHQTQVANQAKDQADKSARQAEIARDKSQTRLLAVQARRAVADGSTPDDIGLAGALALESIALTHKGHRGVEADALEAARSALSQLPLHVLTHGSPVSSLAALADGRLASGGRDGKIKLWRTDGTGEPVVLTHGTDILSLAVLADGRLASGGHDGKIKLWRTDGTGEPVVLTHGADVLSLVVLADGRLASGGHDGKIKLWATDGTGEPVVLTHGTDVRSLAVLADGRLASGGDDGKIRLWPKDGRGEPVVLTHGDSIMSLAVLADGRLASGIGLGGPGMIKVWRTDGTGEPEVRTHHEAGVYSLAVLADGRLASGGFVGQIILEPTSSEPSQVVTHGGGLVSSLVVLADGRLASGGANGEIKIWPWDGTGEPIKYYTRGMALAVLADGRLASCGRHGDEIYIWPKNGTGEPVVLITHGSRVRSLVALVDGRLASGGEDGKIMLWRTDGTGDPVVLTHGDSIMSLAVLADGRLASGGQDGKIKLWRTDGAGDRVVLMHGASVMSLAVLADGRLASGGQDGKIKLWRTDGTGDPVVLMHGASVMSLAVLADGRLASGGQDGKIKLWRTDGTGDPVVLTHGVNRVLSLAVLADRRLASGGTDRKIKLWHTDGTGNPLTLTDGGEVASLAVLADGRLASGAVEGTIKLWIVNEEKLIAALCLRAGRNLTNDEWARYIGSDTPWAPSCGDRPSNWRTVDENNGGAPALIDAPAEARPTALQASSRPAVPPTSEKASPAPERAQPPAAQEPAAHNDSHTAVAAPVVPPGSEKASPAPPEPAQPPVVQEQAAQSSRQTAVAPASEKESPVPAPVFGDPGNSGKPRVVATPVAPKNPGPRPAQGSQHVAQTAPRGDMPTPTGNTTSQLNQQELARQKSVASMPDNIISGFFRSLFR